MAEGTEAVEPVSVLQHSGPYRSDECPTIGCDDERLVRAELRFADGRRRVVSACERHVAWYVARAVMRMVAQRGREAVLRHVDG